MHGDSRNKVLLSFFNNNSTCLGPRGSSFTCRCSAWGTCVTVAKLFVFNDKLFCCLCGRGAACCRGVICALGSRRIPGRGQQLRVTITLGARGDCASSGQQS